MMHYRKGDNVEEELKKEDLPFDDCMPKGHKDFLWMHVKGGTKVSNVMEYAKKALEKGECRTIVWSGVGGGVVKTVSCAEILKRSFPLYQVTRMSQSSIQEHWIPQMEGLEEIIANRRIPALHILMSLDEIDESVDGLQKPNTVTDFWVTETRATSSGQKDSRHRDVAGKKRQRPKPKPQQSKQQKDVPAHEGDASDGHQQKPQRTQGNPSRLKAKRQFPPGPRNPQSSSSNKQDSPSTATASSSS